MSWCRVLATWLVLIVAETFHGVVRVLLLMPLVGDFRARQIAVFTGSVLILVIVYLAVPWLGLRTRGSLLAAGTVWLGLTLAFEIGLGRLVLDLDWDRIVADYDLQRGGLLPLGLTVLLLAPLLAATARRLVGADVCRPTLDRLIEADFAAHRVQLHATRHRSMTPRRTKMSRPSKTPACVDFGEQWFEELERARAVAAALGKRVVTGSVPKNRPRRPSRRRVQPERGQTASPGQTAGSMTRTRRDQSGV